MRYYFKLILLPLFCLLSFTCSSQVYTGIKEVEKYKSQLGKLDTYLQLDPKKCDVEYEKLLDIAKSKKNKTLETVLYIYKGTILYYTGRNDESVVYFEKAIELANKIGNDQLRSSATIRKIFVIDGYSDAKAMLRLMQDEFDDADERDDTLNMIYSMNGIAMNFERLDSTEQALETYHKAMKLAEDNGNDFEYGFLLNNLGLMKLRLKDPEDARKDFNKGIKISKKLENIRLELILRENLGYYYMVVDSIDLAEKEFTDSYELAKSRNYAHLAFNSLVNLGSVERKRGNQEKADSLMQTALDDALHEKLYYAVPMIFLNMSQIQISKENYKLADRYMDSAMHYAKYASVNEIQEGYYILKYQMHQKKEDFKTALDYYKKLTNFRDSLNDHGHLEVLKQMQLKYDVEKKEKQRVEEAGEYEKEIAKKELEAANLRQNIGIGTVVVIVLIGGFLIYYFREKHKKEIEFSSAIVNRLEEERGRIARDLHDGLGQSLIVLKNKFNKLDIPEDEHTENINENFTDTIEQVRSISRSLIPPELRRLGLKKAIQKILQEIENSSLMVATSELDVIDELDLDSGQEIRIYRIIQELSNNTLKHSEATSLKVEFEKSQEGFNIVYQDNGKGIDPEVLQNEKDSVGLRSIQQRLRYLGGTIRYDKVPKGFKATIRIKIKR
jgi:signal transduction histidine kinase